MRNARLTFAALPLLLGLFVAGCQASGTNYEFQMIVPADAPPAEVEEILQEISADSLMRYMNALVSFGTRHTLSETESDTRGIGAARRWIKSEFDRISAESGRTGDLALQVSMDRHIVEPDGRRITSTVEIVNPVCVIPGAMPEARDRLYYIIAHYDSRASDPLDGESDAPGANDDASGVAVTIEMARVLAKHRFDATIVCMPTAGEEQGLYGARLHAEDAVAEEKDIRAVLSNDMVGDPSSPFGGAHDTQVRVFSEGLPRSADENAIRRIQALAAENDSDSRQLARYITEVGAWHDLPVKAKLVHRADRFLRGGDHTPFNRLGMPAVRFTVVEEIYERQHQDVRVENGVRYGDLIEYIDPDYLRGAALLNAASLIHLANAPSTPQNARLITAELTPDTTIRWSPSPEPDVEGYQIVWRDTISPAWTGKVDVGDVTEHTLKLSKDNYLFGVRAYDRDGYYSPVAFPSAAAQ